MLKGTRYSTDTCWITDLAQQRIAISSVGVPVTPASLISVCHFWQKNMFKNNFRLSFLFRFRSGFSLTNITMHLSLSSYHNKAVSWPQTFGACHVFSIDVFCRREANLAYYYYDCWKYRYFTRGQLVVVTLLLVNLFIELRERNSTCTKRIDCRRNVSQ